MQVKDIQIIRRLMAVEDMSARQLAAEAGYASHAYVNRILAGDVTTVTPERARMIARSLKVDTEVIFMPRTSTGGRRSAVREAS